MNYILFDGNVRNRLLPFTFTRPVADIRVGILTIREKWEHYLGFTTTTLTEDYLSSRFSFLELENNIFINSSFFPTENIANIVKGLTENQALFYQDEPIAFFAAEGQEVNFDTFDVISYTHHDVRRIENTWDIFSMNGEAIKRDFKMLTENKISQPIPEGVWVKNPENVFIEEGAEINFCTLNASEGPIYIGKNATVMEGALVRGPFALCEGAALKMGAKIYGDTTVGPHSKVGGEVGNSVIFGYSNKGHDGFLGNSVIGEWCNLGADTNTSNLKNNYAEVRLWNYETEGFARTGLQFCGLMMGDHSKCSINTMFNTGTVVGVSANIFGSGFPKNFVPSFTWGGASGFTTHKLQKFEETAAAVMKRRGRVFDEVDKDILQKVFELTEVYRIWEKGI